MLPNVDDVSSAAPAASGAFAVPAESAVLVAAARCLQGECAALFPTETFYAVGCCALSARAVALVYQLKGRSVQKPLPLLAASAEQAASVVRLDCVPKALITRFWPGPLTLLLPARCDGSGQPLLPQILCNAEGKAAIRVSSHPTAAALAQAVGSVITASSANLSGHPSARLAADLAPALVSGVLAQGGCLVPLTGPEPAGGMPSTLLEPLPDGRLRLRRAGAICVETLAEAGFVCCSEMDV